MLFIFSLINYSILVALVDSDEIFIKGMQTLFLEHNIPLNKIIFDYKLELNTIKILNVLIVDPFKNNSFGVLQIRESLDINPNLRIIVITSISNKNLVDEVIDLGVNAVLFKCCKTDEFIHAYFKAIKGECHYCSSIYSKNKLVGIKIDELTDREQEVVNLIIDGKTTAEISEQLERSVHTINSHRKNILKKLNIKTPLELLKLSSEQSI